MKKILSFFVFIIFITTAFESSIVTSFAMHQMPEKATKVENQQHYNMKKDMPCCDEEKGHDRKSCKHSCCIEASDTNNQTYLNNNTQIQNREVKIKLKNNYLALDFSYKLPIQRKLTKKTSPPPVERKLKNYSYKDLTKIIKSNT